MGLPAVGAGSVMGVFGLLGGVVDGVDAPGVRLTELTKTQVEFLGVDVDGPDKRTNTATDPPEPAGDSNEGVPPAQRSGWQASVVEKADLLAALRAGHISGGPTTADRESS